MEIPVNFLFLLLLHCVFLFGLPLNDTTDAQLSLTKRDPIPSGSELWLGAIPGDHGAKTFHGYLKVAGTTQPYLLPDDQKNDRTYVATTCRNVAENVFRKWESMFKAYHIPETLIFAVVHVPDVGFYYATKPTKGTSAAQAMLSSTAINVAEYWKRAASERETLKHLHSEDAALYKLEERVRDLPVRENWEHRAPYPYRGSYLCAFGYYKEPPNGVYIKPCADPKNSPISCQTVLIRLGIASERSPWTK
ncbi:hypothetical protein PRK78_005701 [Emydomyces testavorans]|uniref:Uncharacterized protein n=1 Tax=Emydomyces testavorans TaxID=2070801 RepID=A0AAF0DMP1_9EURO|nr:hypothetical protein PRK78_005701 [Emydomyces testavorans]